MSEYQRIIGEELIIEHFTRAVTHNKISHSYILNGESGMGKKTLARYFSVFSLAKYISNGKILLKSTSKYYIL